MIKEIKEMKSKKNNRWGRRWLAVLSLTGLMCLRLMASASIEQITVVEGGGYFPVAISLVSGEILAVVRGGGAHLGRAGRLDLVMSDDGGRTWSKPWTVVDGPEDDRNPALGQLADGTILLAYAVLSGYEADGQRLPEDVSKWVFDGVYVIRSKDKGKTWTKPELSPEIHAFYAGGGAVSPYGKIIQLEDGTVIMAVYFDFFDDRGNQSYVFRSKDGGKTWGEPSLVAEHFNETAVLALPDGSLLAAMRSEKGGHLAVSRSEDDGKHWSPPFQITQDMEHPADLIQLKNGQTLLSYGERNAPMGVRAIFSRDGGKTWEWDKKIIISASAPNTDCGYPSSVEVDRGQIVTLYYQVDDRKNAPQSTKCLAARWKIPDSYLNGVGPADVLYNQ